jgi:hypothetical protein
LLEALIGQRVEAAIVQAADVGDEADLHPLARGALVRARVSSSRVAVGSSVVPVVVVAAATGRDGGEEERDQQNQQPRQLSRYVHGTSLLPMPSDGIRRIVNPWRSHF